MLRLGGEVQARSGDCRSDRWDGQRSRPVEGRLLRLCRQGLLNPDLGGVGDPHLVVRHADHERHVLAAQLDAAGFQQLHHTVDVLGTVGAHTDQGARGLVAQSVMVDHRRGVELDRKVPRSKGVAEVVALLIGELGMLNALQHRAMRPTERLGLLAPHFAVALAGVLGQALRQGRLAQDLELLVGRDAVPIGPSHLIGRKTANS